MQLMQVNYFERQLFPFQSIAGISNKSFDHLFIGIENFSLKLKERKKLIKEMITSIDEIYVKIKL